MQVQDMPECALVHLLEAIGEYSQHRALSRPPTPPPPLFSAKDTLYYMFILDECQPWDPLYKAACAGDELPYDDANDRNSTPRRRSLKEAYSEWRERHAEHLGYRPFAFP